LRKESERRMAKKKYALLLLLVMLAVVVVNFAVTNASNSLTCSTNDDGVVDKAQGDAFTVKVTFENTGKTDGNWSINITFEGANWTWAGTAQNLTLKPGSTKTLTWNGNVPANATINSVARLVVYYNDSYKALDWWIHVVPGAELSITSSTVE
jgi:cytochrome c oxidase assembly protein Cox11